jgi:hypothetical protein
MGGGDGIVGLAIANSGLDSDHPEILWIHPSHPPLPEIERRWHEKEKIEAAPAV